MTTESTNLFEDYTYLTILDLLRRAEDDPDNFKMAYENKGNYHIFHFYDSAETNLINFRITDELYKAILRHKGIEALTIVKRIKFKICNEKDELVATIEANENLPNGMQEMPVGFYDE